MATKKIQRLSEGGRTYINKGNKLTQLEIYDSVSGDGVVIKYYNSSFGKETTLIINKAQIDEFCKVLQKMQTESQDTIKLQPMVQELLKTEASILDQFMLDVARNIPQASIKTDIKNMVAMGKTDPYATAASTLEWILLHYPKNAQVQRLVQRYLKPVRS